jgi:acyl-CoA synthetase
VFLQELTEAAKDARVQLPLRMFACGGASVPRAVMERSEEQGIPAARVYGMTELPTVTIMNRANSFDLRATTDGALAPGVEVRTLGDDCQPLPTGFAGELVVRGPERMLGYLDPEANRAALDDDGWFRTGDVGVLDDEGRLAIVDRKKDVINISGFNVSPAEVEVALSAHRAVANAVVVGEVDGDREVVVAHVVAAPGQQVTEAELIEHCRAQLSRFKVPTRIVMHDELPVTDSGKAVRRLLGRSA